MINKNLNFNVLIIGLGNIGFEYDCTKNKKKFILSHSKSFSWHKDFNLIGAVDSDKEKCKKFQALYNKNAYTDLNKALKHLKADLIVISSPTSTLTQIFECIIKNYYPKIILIEKPMSFNFDEAKNIVAKAYDRGINLFVNYTRRSQVEVNVIKEKIHSLNTNFRGNVWYSRGVYNGASHFINLLEYWFGATKNIKVFKNGEIYNDFDYEPDFEIEFSKGLFHFSPLKIQSYFHNSIDMFYNNGRIRYDLNGRTVFYHELESDDVFEGYKVLDSCPSEFEVDFTIIQSYVTNNLSLFLRGEKYFLCSGKEALETLKIIEAIRKKNNYLAQLLNAFKFKNT